MERMHDTEQAMQTIAAAPAGHFKTMLRFLAGGFHLDQASRLIALRSKVPNAVLATDDFNIVLNSCAFGTEEAVLQKLVTSWKQQGKLVGAAREWMLAEATQVLERHDLGEVSHLGLERLKRSKEMHDPDMRAAMGLPPPRRGGDSSSSEPAAAPTGAAGGGSVAGAKRGRDAASAGAGSSVGASAEAGGGGGPPLESAKEAGTSPPPAAPVAALLTPEAIGAAFKGATRLLADAFAEPPGRFAAARHAKAALLMSRLRAETRLAPNPRTYVLCVKAALAARAIDDARALLAEAERAGVLSRATLFQFMQPAFLAELTAAGVIEPGRDLLEDAEPGSQKHAFLLAAAAAARGDQFGSKHGAALVRDGAVVAVGHNHRFGIPGDAHLRVMHAEVHAIVQVLEAAAASAAAAAGAEAESQEHAADAAAQAGARQAARAPPPRPPLPASGCVSEADRRAAAATLRGCDVYIVELDGHGVGYEEAVPCPMCQSAVCALGVGRALYSAHSGIVCSPVAFRPDLACQSLQMARQRVYPKGTARPNEGHAAANGGAPPAKVHLSSTGTCGGSTCSTGSDAPAGVSIRMRAAVQPETAGGLSEVPVAVTASATGRESS